MTTLARRLAEQFENGNCKYVIDELMCQGSLSLAVEVYRLLSGNYKPQLMLKFRTELERVEISGAVRALSVSNNVIMFRPIRGVLRDGK